MITDDRCTDFLTVLASAAPVPGGGGASAFVGAMGTALGCMVANLTLGKKKYADVQEDIQRIIGQAEDLRHELTALVEKDAEVFEPLSKAYGLPKETEEQQRYKAVTLEQTLKAASGVPYEIMERAMEAMDLHAELATKGTRIAVSDVGVGVQFCKAALMGASLNVYINTKLMKDRAYADDLNRKVEAMLAEGMAKADRIYREVEASLK